MTPLTPLTALITGVVFVLLVIFAVRGYRRPEFRSIAPALMTSLGILGTFTGIVVGLIGQEWTQEGIADSIQTLLSGMVGAFATSVLGLSSSIAFRYFEPSFPGTFVSPEQRDVLARLDAVSNAISGDHSSSLATQVQSLSRSISGEDPSSLAKQMQALRKENGDGFRKLHDLPQVVRDTLNRNLEDLVEETTKVLTRQFGEHQKLVKGMVDNIEEALIKQFGQTFVEFNEATQALRKWQDEHRAQVEQLTAAFDVAARNTTTIAEECSRIPPTMEKLREHIGVAQQDAVALNEQLGSFAVLRQQAEEFFPAMKQHYDETAQVMKTSAGGFSAMEESLKEMFAFVERDLRRVGRQHLETVETMTKAVVERAQQDTVTDVMTIVRTSMERFDDEMKQKVEKSSHVLVAIAEKCAEVIRTIEGRR